MKIAFNPSTVAALITPPNNKDITFDLRGRNIFARGVKFCGTDTNTWRDIKINNVSIGSNILDLRNGSNTTLTNTNGVVTINSTWRPVVDNLTSNSTTSSLSANQGRVLVGLINGKSDSGHNHDNRYLKLTGGTLTGNLIGTAAMFSGRFYGNGDDEGIIVKPSSNGYAGLILGTHNGERSVFYLTKGNPFWRYNNGSTNLDIQHPKKPGVIALTSDIPSSLKNPHALTISLNGTSQGPYDGSTAKNINITPSSIGAATSEHTHDDRYYTKAESNAKYITDITTSVNKLTFTKNGSNITRDIRVNNVQSLGRRNPLTERNAISGIYTYGTYSNTDNLAPSSYFETLGFGEGAGGTIEIGGSWISGGKLYWRALRDCCEDWFSWKTILDSSNYSGILDSRYYTESEVNNLLDAKLNRQNLSYGTWNPRGYNLAADYSYNGGDLSISESGGKIHISVDGYFWQNEGQYRVLDTSDVAGLKNNLTVHQYLSNTDTTWWPLIWGGNSHNNTSDSTGEVYKSHNVLSWQTSSQTLYATNIQTENIKHLSIGGGIYWNPYVESTTDGSDVASITVVKSGVAGGTTLVLSQMNDANDTIQFKTNGSARLYHNSYPILTTQNTYVSNNKGYINGTEITQVNNANKWTTSRAFTVGNTSKSVDGTSNVSWSLSEIGVKDTWRTVQVNGTSIGNNTLNLCGSTYIGLTNVNGKVTFSLVGSGTTANQAILSNGTANGWTLKTLNIANWDAAYNFVSTITGQDADKVINKWEEIVNFLAGITEDNKLNTLLNSKLSIQQLSAKEILTTKTNNALFWVNTKGTASSITTGPFTDHPYALLSVTNYNQNAENNKFFYRSRLAFSSAGDIKVASCHHENEYKQDETWYNVLTSKNSGISGSTIKLNGTSITVYSSSTADGRYVKKTGDTMSGTLTIDTTNFGALTIKRNDDANGASIQFRGKSSVYGYIGLNNSTKDKQFLRWGSDTSKAYTILDTSSTYTSNGKGVINGTTITQVDNATNSTNSTNARKLVNWYSSRPTSLNTQFGDGSLRIFYATSFTTEGKPAEDSHILHLAWDNNGGWDAQLAVHTHSGKVSTRAQNSGTWQPWKTLAFTTDIPTSLPANGGNADTVDGYHASGLLTALSNSNRGISLTVGGTTKSLSNISVGDADTVDRYHANTIYNAPSFIVSNGNTSNTYILLATITISGTSLSCAEFTTLFQNRECLDNSSFILSGAIRRDSPSNVRATLSYVTLHTGTPRNIYLRSDDGVTFRVYIQSAAGSWTTYYRAIPIVDSGNITYSNTGTTSPISGSVLNIIATKGGNVNYASSAGSANTATKLTSSAGNAALPIYFSDGKPVACTASSVFSNLSNSGNNLSITVAGQNRALTVGYATSAGSATKVIVNQHTNNDTNYPLVWSNQSNTNSVTENQLYKSWSDLYYNPKNKRLTVGGSVVASSFIKSDGTSQQLLRADGGIAAFNWSGQSGQPTWLWGGNNEHSYYVYNPSNFRVAYAASAGNADTLDGIDSTKFLRQVVVPNNTENDFNTFSNMTLTGRVDPTTGASLKNAPWSGSGPAGGYGVLTYLFNGSGYGTQMAWECGSNRIYIRNRHWGGSGVGSVWRTSWDTLALTTDIPSSLKNPYSLTLKANGTTLATYDGSSAKEANFTYANVGAASASHTHSNYVTDLGTSGNYLTWTKNGNTSNITVPYAGKTDWLISQGSFSTKEQVDAFFDTVNHSLKVAYIGDKAFPEFSDGLVLAASVPKSYCHQIHMDDNQPVIHHRARNGDGSGWSKWSKLLDSSNYSSYAIPVSASCNKNWSYNGQSDQPTWLWGTNDGTNCYVWNPSNFSVAKSEYSRSLLGRSTSGSDYDTNSSNLVFAEWNTMNDSRWYLKATDHECRVDYANSAGSVSNSLNIFGVSYNGSAAKTVTTSTFVSQLSEGTSTVTDGTMFITSRASNSGFADTNAVNVPYKRKASCLWSYIDNKVSSKYLSLAGGTMNGNARIDHGSGNLYIGNSGNDGWIYTQDIASQSGTDKWNIRTSGAAHFGNVYICTKSNYTTYDSSIIECYNDALYLNYYSSRGINLCNGGGTVQIGPYTTGDTGNNKLYVNGSEFINGASNVKDHVFANGFRHRSHNSDDSVLLAGGGYSQGVPVRYWAIYYMYIGNSSTDITYTKRSGNYDFITSEAWESEGSARFDISFPSGYNKNNTLIFGNGDHRTSSSWKTSVYVTITTSTAFGTASQIRVMISDDANLNVGFANIYFMCMG